MPNALEIFMHPGICNNNATIFSRIHSLELERYCMTSYLFSWEDVLGPGRVLHIKRCLDICYRVYDFLVRQLG